MDLGSRVFSALFFYLLVRMYWSKYNIISKSEKYGYLLYNTMSQVFIQIDKDNIDMWQNLRDNPDSYASFQQADFLLKSRIIVANQHDDLNLYLADVLKNRYNSSDLALTILPTRGCNFGCIYCYETDRQPISMNEETEKAIVRFVTSNPNLKRLSVVWYGGEPLLNFSSVERLTADFLKLGVDYSAKMVTNGFLLSRDKAVKLEALRIRNIQVTLDGPERIHDQRRMLLDGKPTYRRIMDNLKTLLEVNDTITVDIRSNIDRRNMEEYAEFIDSFKKEIDNPRVNLYPGFVSDLLSSECVSPEHNISEGGYKAQFALDLFDRYGIEIKSFLPKFRRHSCVASKYFAFVIGPEGELYKCWRRVGHPGHVLGNVRDGVTRMPAFVDYIVGSDYTRDPKCLACEFIALCGGGCPLVRLRNRDEHLDLNHCCPEKTHMEKLMEMRYEMYLKAGLA